MPTKKSKPKPKAKVKAKSKPVSKRRPGNGGDQVQKITINARCTTNPQEATLSITCANGHPNQVQFHCGQGQSFTLQMPGGVFDGQPNSFQVDVNGSSWVPSPPLKAIAAPTGGKIVNYVYQNGQNCQQLTEDDPPDIVIES
jgi:hypothetical protein